MDGKILRDLTLLRSSRRLQIRGVGKPSLDLLESAPTRVNISTKERSSGSGAGLPVSQWADTDTSASMPLLLSLNNLCCSLLVLACHLLFTSSAFLVLLLIPFGPFVFFPKTYFYLKGRSTVSNRDMEKGLLSVGSNGCNGQSCTDPKSGASPWHRVLILKIR